MKKILVTGANGYIGSRLVETLAKNGYGVIAHCYPDIPDDKKWQGFLIDSIIGDIRDDITIDKLTRSSVDAAVHLVSLDHHQSEKQPRLVSSVNVQPTWNLLDGFSRKETAPRFIYFSTVQVYGNSLKGEITEDCLTAPYNAYGLTHRMSEEICNYYHATSAIDCFNVRLSNSYGIPVFKEANCWWLVVNDLCQQAVHDKRIVLQSDGRSFRDFIHSTDVFRAVESIINSHKKILQGNTFNLSSGKTVTILELAHLIQNLFKKQFGLEIPVVLPDQKLSDTINTPLLKTKYVVDNSKFKHLGFNPQTSLEEGITELFNYLSGLNE